MAENLSLIGFDADDTLWHNERVFRLTQERFAELLTDYAPQDHLMDRLLAAEKRNVGHYGFGVKGFVLSMIETAIDVTEERVAASVIAELISAGQEMLQYPIDLLPHVEDTVREIAETHHVLLITKGDLLDQERKLAQSGLGDLFDGVEILSGKSRTKYEDVFGRYETPPNRAMMVGNSMRSDVLPVIAAGGWGVHVPHDLTWAYEQGAAPVNAPLFRALNHLGELPELVREIDS